MRAVSDSERYERAMRSLEAACGELDHLRRKGNFFPSTLAKIDDDSDGICASLREIRTYVEDMNAENDGLREELRAALRGEVDADDDGPLEELAKARGQCAAELAKQPLGDIMAELEAEGIDASREDVRAEAKQIVKAKEEGHECSACAARAEA